MSRSALAAIRTPGSPRPDRHHRALLLTLGLVVVLLTCTLLSLAVGARPISPAVVLGALSDPTALDPAVQNDVVVVRELRVPRTVIGLLVGAGLGIAGVVMQGLTRNPIADPGLLGVNAGAALAVVLGLSIAGVTSPVLLAGFALAGALAAALLIAVLAASARAGASPVLLVVAGAAVSAGLGSISTLVLLSDPAALDEFRFWTVGALTGRSLGAALGLAPLLVLGAVISFGLARALDALALGDDVARALGFRLAPTRVAAVAAIVLLCGTATALAGPLVFVGLLGAHAARRLVGGRHRRLLPVAAVVGAALVLLADSIGRLVAPPGELEVGIVLAALGAPLLIALVRSRRVVAL